MAQMSGADADALERLGGEMERAGRRLNSGRTRLRRTIHSSPWSGASADRFRHEFDSVHSTAMAEAARFLDEARETLVRNAREQRTASGEGGSVRTAAPDRTPDRDRAADPARDLLLSLGLTAEQIDELLKRFGNITGILGDLNKFLEDDSLGMFLSAVGEVFDVIDVVTDLLTDLGEHSHLPPDEALVHAIAETGARFAASEGVEKMVTVLTPILGAVIGSVVPGPGTALGGLTGKVIGFIAGKIAGEVVGSTVDAIDSRLNVYDGSADLALEGYRYLKERDFDMGAVVVDGLVDAGENVVKGAQNVAKGALDTAKNVGGFLNPFD
jgi:uncharacterized protein YukE